MNTNPTNELFRLSAILYADNNYEVSPKTTHRKIIESALIENGNQFITIPNLCIYINATYELVFSEDEINDIIKSPKNSGFEISSNKGKLIVRLTNEREDVLRSKIKDKTIDDYIVEFETLFSISAKELIYKFLYELFSNDVGSFQKLINAKKQTTEQFRVNPQNYSDSEKDIINNFLNWEQPFKDKAIFDISSYAIEYSILTNKSNSLSFQSLRNKQIYLDANVIYRALGINGEAREVLTKTFLQKFNDVGEKLIITKFTEEEFKDSIKFHINNIRRFNNPRVSSSVYVENSFNEEICNFYHKWRSKRVNSSTDLFLAHIYNLYDEFVKKYNITIEKKCPYNIEDEHIQSQLREMSAQIYSPKQQQDNTAYENSAYIDAENTLWIETKRGNKCNNIHETGYFLISTDQVLRRWDYLRNDNIPIVLLPSQWLSIILRFLNRTNDDYKSFVNFLNLRSNEQAISGEKLQIILAGISEITADVETQRGLMNILVENRFKDIINGDKDDETIFERAKYFAKSETDKRIEELKQNQDDLKNTVNSLTDLKSKQERARQELEASKEKAIKDKERLLKNKEEALSAAVNQYNIAIKVGRDSYVASKMRNSRISTAFFNIITLCVLIYMFYALFFPEKLDNFISINIFTIIDGVPSETGCYSLRTLISAGVLGLITYSAKLFISRFISSEKIRVKKDQFANEYFAKIKLESQK